MKQEIWLIQKNVSSPNWEIIDTANRKPIATRGDFIDILAEARSLADTRGLRFINMLSGKDGSVAVLLEADTSG